MYKAKTDALPNDSEDEDELDEEDELEEDEDYGGEEGQQWSKYKKQKQNDQSTPPAPQAETSKDNNNIDENINEEHEEALFGSNANESFNSLTEQGNNTSVLNYLTGKGQIEWNPSNYNSQILPSLMRFREINIAVAQSFKILNDIRVLSLSYIFVFGHTSLNLPRLCEYLSLKECSEYCAQFEIPPIENANTVTTDILKLLNAYNLNLHNLDNLNYMTNGSTGLAHTIITNISNCLPSWNTSTHITECQFSEQNVFTLLLPLFTCCRSYELSKYDKAINSMPDYRSELFITLKLKFNVDLDFFVCEIKKSGCSNKKYESDFVQLQREFKSIIESQIKLGIDDPWFHGLLVEGYDCYLYKMKLEYDGKYRSNMIARFRLMRDAQDLVLLLPAINVLKYLNGELIASRTKIMNTPRSKRGQSAVAKYKRPSFLKPVKLK